MSFPARADSAASGDTDNLHRSARYRALPTGWARSLREYRHCRPIASMGCQALTKRAGMKVPPTPAPRIPRACRLATGSLPIANRQALVGRHWAAARAVAVGRAPDYVQYYRLRIARAGDVVDLQTPAPDPTRGP